MSTLEMDPVCERSVLQKSWADVHYQDWGLRQLIISRLLLAEKKDLVEFVEELRVVKRGKSIWTLKFLAKDVSLHPLNQGIVKPDQVTLRVTTSKRMKRLYDLKVKTGNKKKFLRKASMAAAAGAILAKVIVALGGGPI